MNESTSAGTDSDMARARLAANRGEAQKRSRRIALGLFGVAAILVAASAPGVASQLRGGSYRLIGSPTGGGGRSDGGDFWVVGSILTPAQGVSKRGGFEVMGGLVGVYALPVIAGEVPLLVDRTADGQALLSWPASAAGYQLEVSTALGPEAVWQAVSPAPEGNTYTTPYDQPARFYRLRKP